MAEERIEKNVILCRSGKQRYHIDELRPGWSAIQGMPPAKEKEWYVEYRPSGVVAAAADKCKGIPLCLEHPADGLISADEQVHREVQGCVGSQIKVVSLDEDTIGVKSDLYFYTDEIYDYYRDNREVSLGYSTRKRWAENPEACGYDIILEEITSINHVALTRRGRGGSKVAIIDSELKEEKIEDSKTEERKEEEQDAKPCETEEKPCEDFKEEEKPEEEENKDSVLSFDSVFREFQSQVLSALDSIRKSIDDLKKPAIAHETHEDCDSGVSMDSEAKEPDVYDSEALRRFLG